MTTSALRVGIGTRFIFDGETVEVVELVAKSAGNEVLLKSTRGQRIRRIALKELLYSNEARLIPEHHADDKETELVGVILAELTESERAQLMARAEHVREVLTGYRSGHIELRRADEPRAQFDPQLPLESRYAAKAAELCVTDRTVKRWVRAYRRGGVAALAVKHLERPTIQTGLSNARSEGYNRIVKHVGRVAFGFRTPENQRRRVRWACTRQSRRAPSRTRQLRPC